jgi:hypothetical protein
MSRIVVHDVQESTLAELRQALADAEGMPDSAVVRVRTRLGANGEGSLVKRIHISEHR